MRFLVLVITLWGLVGLPAYAEKPATASAHIPSEKAIALALPLFEGADFEGQILSTALEKAETDFNAELQALKERKIEISEELAARFKEVTFDEIRTRVSNSMPAIRKGAAIAYARYFTNKELKELLALSKHPVLVKMEKISPALMAEIAEMTVKAEVNSGISIEERLTHILEDYLASETANQNDPS